MDDVFKFTTEYVTEPYWSEEEEAMTHTLNQVFGVGGWITSFFSQTISFRTEKHLAMYLLKFK